MSELSTEQLFKLRLLESQISSLPPVELKRLVLEEARQRMIYENLIGDPAKNELLKALLKRCETLHKTAKFWKEAAICHSQTLELLRIGRGNAR